MGIESLFPWTVFRVAGVPVRDSVIQTWIVMSLLLGIGAWAYAHLRVWDPDMVQLAIEYVVEYIEGQIVGIAGRSLPELVSYLTTMISFVVLSNLLGLIPVLYAPTRDLNTTVALALVSLGSWQYFAIARHGVAAYLRSLVEPTFVMLPLNLLSLVSRTLSMALRLFGNVIASEMIGAVMFMLVPVLVPLPLVMLGIITGVLQGLVFTILTLVFVLDAIGAEDVEAVADHAT